MQVRALCVLVFAAASAHAQGLRLRVVDDSSGQPLRGAWVTLTRDGEVFGEGLTRAGGARFFPAEPGARYRVTVERVGFEPFTATDVRASGDTAVELRVRSPRLQLRGAQVHREASCRERPEGLGAILWAQARVALAGAEQVRSEGSELLAIRRFERMLGRDGTVRNESAVDGRALGSRLFASASAAELSRAGFVKGDSIGSRVYLGPDIPYLLSAEFLRDHCFTTVAGSGEAQGLVGLRFMHRSAKVSGIDGTLWLDGESAELRLFDFTYRHDGASSRNDAAGRVLFDHLASGSWIAREWVLRTPLATQAGQVLGYREAGGETLEVPPSMLAVADSVENSRKPPGRIIGWVIDSLTRRGLAGALVVTDMERPRARSDADGMFSMANVPVGLRRVTFSHPLLDSLGARLAPLVVRVGPDSTTRVTLGLPSLRTLKGGACDDSLGIIAGTVRDVSTGGPMDSAFVVLSWISITFTPDRPLMVQPNDVTILTDSAGRYASCVPPRLDITAYAEKGGLRTGRLEVTQDDRRVSFADLALDRSATDTLAGTARIRGVVLYQDRTPIPGATVLLTDPERSTTTDSLGRFRFDAIPGGTRVVITRALGHAPNRVVVTASRVDTTPVVAFMRRVTQLDPIVVRASAGTAARAVMELEERRRSGIGYRLSPLELLGFRYARMDAVLRALPFARVRGKIVMLTDERGRECAPHIYVDARRTDQPELESIAASEALAVEVFTRASQVPLQYRSSTRCGAILLWTKQQASK